jgi:hypothetical protein
MESNVEAALFKIQADASVDVVVFILRIFHFHLISRQNKNKSNNN